MNWYHTGYSQCETRTIDPWPGSVEEAQRAKKRRKPGDLANMVQIIRMSDGLQGDGAGVAMLIRGALRPKDAELEDSRFQRVQQIEARVL